MIYTNVWLTVITLAMMPVMLRAGKFVAGRSQKYFSAQQTSPGAVNGYIEEMGTHEELMEKKGYYYELVKLQTGVDEL